jgi:hypothetical protein
LTDLLEDVRDATQALAELARADGVLWPRMATALRATCDDVTRRLTTTELAVLLVGPPDGGKRTLINAALGANVLRETVREHAAVMLVRRGDDAHYVCQLRDGGTQSLPSVLRTKTRLVAEAASAAERERSDAEQDLAALRHELGELRTRTEETRLTGPSSLRRLARRFGARLAQFKALVIALLAQVRTWPRRLAPRPKAERTVALQVTVPATEPVTPAPIPKQARFDRILALERALLGAEPRFEEAKKAEGQARAEQAEHAAECARIFIDDVRALTDAEGRGAEVTEITIDYPAAILPPGLVLVDAPQVTQADERARDSVWQRIRDDLGGCIVVSPGGRTNLLAPDLLARLAPITPHGVRGCLQGVVPSEEAQAELAARLQGELPSLFQRIRGESPTLVAAFATRAVSERLGVLTQACVRTRAEVEAQIVEVEERRTKIAAQLRTRTLQRMASAIDEAARTVLGEARSMLRTRINDLGDEWRDALAARDDRAGVDACIREINASAPARLRAACDVLADQIAKEALAASGRLQTSLLAELHVAEPTPSLGRGPAPMILAEAGDATPSARDVPLAATHEAFERKRVGIGLGGAAAGAALGTLIFPGIGTAVGAMVGVLAGLVEGTGSLKRQAIEHVRTYGVAVENEIAAQLDRALPDVTRDLAASVAEALERAIGRREGSLARLFDEADRAMAREHGRLEELARIRESLAPHDDRFVALAGRARSALQTLAAERPS